MITLQEAIDLAIEAHNGQWRKPYKVNGEHNPYLIEVMGNTSGDEEQYTCKDGTLIKNIDEVTWVVFEPYTTHTLTVMNMMNTEEEKIIAVLHDVIEDTEAELIYGPQYAMHFNKKTSLFDLVYNDIIYKINYSIAQALYLLNKSSNPVGTDYNTYIEWISENKLATKVKIADMIHNMSCNPSEKAKQKYLQALPILLKSL